MVCVQVTESYTKYKLENTKQCDDVLTSIFIITIEYLNIHAINCFSKSAIKRIQLIIYPLKKKNAITM